MKSPEQFTRSEESSTPVNPNSLKVEGNSDEADADSFGEGEDNLSSCSSTSSQSSSMFTALNQSDASSCSSTTSLCGWCQKQGLKLFTLRTAEGSKAFCSELCFTQCRRASFKKNKVCNWCKHVRHTVNYVDYFDGKNQLQFCSTKCLGQYKMNILCREIEMIPPRLLHSLHGPTSRPSTPAANQTETPVPSSTLPVDLCLKRKACSQTEGETSHRHEDRQQQAKPSAGNKSQDAHVRHALERSHVLNQDSKKRHKSHRKSAEDHKKCEDPPLAALPSSSGLNTNGQQHNLRAHQHQQLHLQQLQQQLQSRMPVTPEMMLRSLNGKQAAVAAGHRMHTGRRDRSLGSSSETRSHAVPSAPFLHHHLPCSLPPPPPLHNHHFPPFRPASSSHSLLQQQHYAAAGSSPTPERDVFKPTLSSLKSEPSASSHLGSNRKQQQEHISRSIETPAEESNIIRLRSHPPRHPVCPVFPPQRSPPLLVPMPVVLPFPVPIPIPLFFFQQKALEKIEQLATQLKREILLKESQRNSENQENRCQESEDKSTQVD